MSKVGKLAMEHSRQLQEGSAATIPATNTPVTTCTQYNDETTVWNVCYTCEIKECSCGIFEVCSYGYCPFNATESLTSCKCGVSYNGTACSTCDYTDDAGNAIVDCSNTLCEC